MFELDERLKFDSNLLRLLNKWNETVLKAKNRKFREYVWVVEKE